jgi:hypothetical protein
MQKILGRAGGLGAGRSVAAAARVHPAGFAVPTAVLVTAVVLFTFVTSIAVRVIPPPSSSGSGSAQAVSPSTGQLRHRVQPERRVQPVRAGQLGVTGNPGQNARSLTGSHGQNARSLTGSPGRNARSLTGSLRQSASALPISAAAPPPALGRGPGGIQNPSSSPSGGGTVSDVTQATSSAAAATAAIARSTQPIIAQVTQTIVRVTQTIIAQVPTGGSGTPSSSLELAVQSNSTSQSAAASAQSGPSVNVPVAPGSLGSDNGSVTQAPAAAATATAASGNGTQPGITQVQAGRSQGGWGQGDLPQSVTQNIPSTQTAGTQAWSAQPAPSGNVPVSPGSPGPDGGPVTQAPPAAGTATVAAG